MNNLFRYVGQEINPYNDADFKQPDFPKKDYHLPQFVRGLEESEAVRFVNGENIIPGERIDLRKKAVEYEASVSTQKPCNPEKLEKSIRHWVAYCLLGQKTPKVEVTKEDGVKRRYLVKIIA